MRTPLLSLFLALVLALLPDVPFFPLPVRAGSPTTLSGSFRYSQHGPSAAIEGIAAGILFGSAVAPVAVARMGSAIGLITSLAGGTALGEMMNQINRTVPVDLAAMLPMSATYDATVAFTLEEGQPGVYRLVDGSLRWNCSVNAEITGNGTVISDQLHGSGSYTLQPGKDKIALTFDLKHPEVTYDLEVEIEHPAPTNGLSRWSAMDGLVELEWRAQNGMVTFGGQSFGEPIPEEVVQDEATPHGFYYQHHGDMEELTFMETWRDPADAQVLVEYTILDECSTEIVQPPENGRWTLSEGEGRILEKDLKGESIPEVWAEDLTWILPAFGALEAQFDPDPPRAAQAHFWYEGKLPENNDAFGPLTVRAEYGEASFECADPPAREVRVFFLRDASNNPDGTTPNWFYYWLDTGAAQGHKGAIGYEAGLADYGVFRGYLNPWLADRIYVGNLFSGGASGAANPISGKRTEGIDFFATVVRHEWTHLDTYQDWWGEGGLDADRDLDGDYVPDDREAALGLSSTSFDSLGYGFRDAEYPAYANEDTWPTGSVNRQDWADPGKQSGS